MLTHGCVTVCLKHNDPGSFNLTLHFYYYNTKNYKSFIHFLLPAKQLKWSGKKSISMLKPTWLWAAIKLYKLLWVLPVFVQINQIKNSFILKTYDTQQLTALKILKVLIPVISECSQTLTRTSGGRAEGQRFTRQRFWCIFHCLWYRKMKGTESQIALDEYVIKCLNA